MFAWAAPESARALFASILQAAHTRSEPTGPLENAVRAVGTSLFFTVAMLGLAVLALRKPGSPRVAVGVLALVAVDLLWTARKTVWLGPASLYREPAVATRLKELTGSPPTRLFRMDKPLKASAPPSRSIRGARPAARVGAGDAQEQPLRRLRAGGGHQLQRGELRRWRALMDAFAQQPQKVAELYAGCLLLTPPQACPPAARARRCSCPSPPWGSR